MPSERAMTRIWIVWRGADRDISPDPSPIAWFSTKEKAEAFIAERSRFVHGWRDLYADAADEGEELLP